MTFGEITEFSDNKKVILRERKRHTVRCVASTCCGVPVKGYTVILGVPPILTWDRVLRPGLTWDGGTPLS